MVAARQPQRQHRGGNCGSSAAMAAAAACRQCSGSGVKISNGNRNGVDDSDDDEDLNKGNDGSMEVVGSLAAMMASWQEPGIGSGGQLGGGGSLAEVQLWRQRQCIRKCISVVAARTSYKN